MVFVTNLSYPPFEIVRYIRAMIDTHTHCYVPEIKDNLNEVVQRFENAGGKYIVNCAADLSSSHEVISQAIEFPNTMPTVGLHPELIVPGTDIYIDGIDEKWIEKNIEQVQRLLDEYKNIVAVGEIGLDYYWIKRERLEGMTRLYELQKDLLAKQIDLAREAELPVVLHCRDEDNDKQAESEILELLVKVGESKVKGVFHSYTGSMRYLEDILALGFYVSFNGIITYKSGDNVRELLDATPVEQLLLETDTPWLVPNRYRSAGARVCEPAFVDEVAEFAAKRKGLTKERLWKIVEKNSKELFGV